MAQRISSPRLVGRARELSELADHVTDAVAGSPNLCLLAGEAGIGKTRLTLELQRERGDEVLHLRGQCVALAGGEFPFAPIVGAFRDLAAGPFADAIDGLSGEAESVLRALLPELHRAAPEEPEAPAARLDARHVHELLLRTLRRLTAVVPTCLVIEDLHRADESTRHFLLFMTKNLRRDHDRLVVIATYRTYEVTPGDSFHVFLDELRRCDGVGQLELSRLTLEQTGDQLDAIAGSALARSRVAAIHSRAEGNPFLAEELLASVSDGIAEPLPAALRDVLLPRVRAMPDDVQALLRLLATFGRSVAPGLLSAALDRPQQDVYDDLRLARERHVLVFSPGGETVGFRHALVGEAVYSELLLDERRALHARAVEALSGATDGAASELAYHHRRAGHDAQALSGAVAAGLADTQRYAYPEALASFEAALELWETVSLPPDGVTLSRGELYLQAAEAARLAGEYPRAVALCEEAFERVDPDDEPLTHARLVERLGRYRTWDVDESLTAFRRAQSLLPAEANADRARALVGEALALGLQGSWAEARDRATAGLDVACHLGAPAEECSARATLGIALAFLGDCEAGERELRQARTLAERLARPEELARVYIHAAELERLRGRHAEALIQMQDGAVAVAALGASGSYADFMAVERMPDLFRLGRWDELQTLLTQTSHANAGRPGTVVWGAVAGRLAAARGELELAQERLAGAWTVAKQGVAPELIPTVAVPMIELALARGQPAEARERLTEGLALIGDRTDPLNTPPLFVTGVRVEAAIGEQARLVASHDGASAERRARELVDRLDALLRLTPGREPPPTACVHRLEAHAELGALTRDEPTDELWAQVARGWDELGHSYHAAWARLRRAEALLARPGERAEAGALLSRAAVTFRELGARPALEDARSLARRGRLSELEPGPVPADELAHATSTAWADVTVTQLTTREIEVLDLLGDGLTNRQIGERLFISPRTAGTHVSSILGKLDVDSRVKAATLAHRLRPHQPARDGP